MTAPSGQGVRTYSFALLRCTLRWLRLAASATIRTLVVPIRPRPERQRCEGRRPAALAVASSLFAALLAVSLAPAPARAIGPGSLFDLAQVVYGGGNWNPRPNALRRLAWELRKRTSIEPRLEPTQIHLTDRALYRQPFLYLAGDRGFSAWPEAAVVGLRRHLSYGGFLWVDDASGGDADDFNASVRRELARVLPDAVLSPLRATHVLFRTFYLVDRPVGRVQGPPSVEAVERDGRLPVVYTRHDLGGAFARDNFGNWEFAVTPGGERQREQAYRLGVNLAMYALCLEYKDDQVHLPFLDRRRVVAP